MAQVFKKLRGTTSPEFYLGDGDIDTPGDPAAGIRTTSSGEFQYRDSGGSWTVPSGGGGITPEQHRQLDQLVHDLSENSYEEYTYDGSRVTESIVWTDVGKTLRIRDYVYTYSGSKILTETVRQYNASGSVIETLVYTYTYSGSFITSVTCVRTV